MKERLVMQCPQCNNEISPQAAFCNHCGANLAAVPPQASSTPPPLSSEIPPTVAAPPSGYAVPPPVAASSGFSDNSASALAYVTIVPAILFLILEPYNKIPLVRFHCFQSIGLGVSWVVVWVSVSILHSLLRPIPLAFILFILLDFAIVIGFFLLWLITILKASKGEWYKLPIIGDIALKQVQQG
jgi:uncharacterized membrane protein